MIIYDAVKSLVFDGVEISFDAVMNRAIELAGDDVELIEDLQTLEQSEIDDAWVQVQDDLDNDLRHQPKRLPVLLESTI